MTTITRTVDMSVAAVEVDDDGFIEISVNTPLSVDEARDVAHAILKAADEGARYLAEDMAPAAPTSTGPRCTECGRDIEKDPHSTHGWRHVLRASGNIALHAARYDGEDES